MYVVSQITPLEWRKASVCNHDDAKDDNEFHLCKNSLDSLDGLDGHERTLMNASENDVEGNCSENYSTLERQYFKNASELSEENDDAWMNIEHRRNFLEAQNHQHHHHHQNQQHHNQQPQEENELFGSSRNVDENLDIDDDGLIGFQIARHGSFTTSFSNDDDDHNNLSKIELISYENNFNLYNSFWWAMGTLIQTTSDLNPKVFLVLFLC